MECPTVPVHQNGEVWSLVLCWNPQNGSLCIPAVEVLSSNTLGTVSTMAPCGSDVQEELAASVGVVDRVKSESPKKPGMFLHISGRTVTNYPCSGYQSFPSHDISCTNYRSWFATGLSLAAHLSMYWVHPHSTQCWDTCCNPWKR